MVTRETRVLVPGAPSDVFAFLSSVSNVPLFAPGIEEATLLRGAEGMQGASLGLRTRTGRELRAQITHFHAGESWTVVDERSTVAQIEVEDAPGGATLVTATLHGNWRPEQERRIVAEWEKLLRELPHRVAPAVAAAPAR
jgi:hypothetical protein